MGRNKLAVSERKTEIIHAYVTKEQHKKLLKIAKQKQITISQVVRSMALKYIEENQGSI